MAQTTDFADKLLNAIKLSGFAHWDQLQITNENFDSYRDMSGQEMAEAYFKKHDLKKKVKILRVLEHIYKKSNSPSRYSLTTILNTNNVSLRSFFILVKYGITKIQSVGEGTSIIYKWIGSNSPGLADAEYMYNEIEKMNNFKLTEKEKLQLKENKNPVLFEGLKMLENVSEEDKAAKIFAVYKHVHYLKNQERKGNNKQEIKKEVFSREISRKKIEEKRTENIAGDQNIQKFLNGFKGANIVGEKIIVPKEKPEELGEDIIEEGFIFLMNTKVEMYQRFIGELETANRKLEDYIINHIQKTKKS